MNTPRTTAATFQVRSHTPIPDDVVYRSFAEQLETELAEATKELADAQADIAEEIKQGEIYKAKLEKCRTALDKLHIACETSKPEIYDWYLADLFASEARDSALEALDQTK